MLNSLRIGATTIAVFAFLFGLSLEIADTCELLGEQSPPRLSSLEGQAPLLLIQSCPVQSSMIHVLLIGNCGMILIALSYAII